MFPVSKTTVALLNSDQRLCLPDEPLKSFKPTLPLQLCSNYLPALLMIVIHPVQLKKAKDMTVSMNAE